MVVAVCDLVADILFKIALFERANTDTLCRHYINLFMRRNCRLQNKKGFLRDLK